MTDPDEPINPAFRVPEKVLAAKSGDGGGGQGSGPDSAAASSRNSSSKTTHGARETPHQSRPAPARKLTPPIFICLCALIVGLILFFQTPDISQEIDLTKDTPFVKSFQSSSSISSTSSTQKELLPDPTAKMSTEQT